MFCRFPHVIGDWLSDAIVSGVLFVMAMSVYESRQVTEYLPSHRVTLLSSAVTLVVCKSWDLQAGTVLSLTFWPWDCGSCLMVPVSTRSGVWSQSRAGRCPCSWFCLFAFIILGTFRCPGNFKCTKSYKNNTQNFHAAQSRWLSC